MGADTILMAGGCGPCRFGYYSQLHREILRDRLPHGSDPQWRALIYRDLISRICRVVRQGGADAPSILRVR